MLFKLKSLSNHQKKNKVNPVPVRFLSVSWKKNKEKQEKVVNTQTSLFFPFPFLPPNQARASHNRKFLAQKIENQTLRTWPVNPRFAIPPQNWISERTVPPVRAAAQMSPATGFWGNIKADEEVKPPWARPPLGTRKPVVAVTPAEKVTFRGGRPARRKSAVE